MGKSQSHPIIDGLAELLHGLTVRPFSDGRTNMVWL
jgi:hypothetical protein